MFVLPSLFDGYMRHACVSQGSALRGADLNAIGRATGLEDIQDVTAVQIELARGISVSEVQLQASFKINMSPPWMPTCAAEHLP